MLELFLTFILMFVVYGVPFFIISNVKIYKIIALIVQIIMCIFLIPSFFYKKDKIWKDTNFIDQPFYKSLFLPIKSIKNKFGENNTFIDFEIQKTDGIYNIYQTNEYNKECMENYFIKESDDCPITDIKIEKKKTNKYKGYKVNRITNEVYLYYTNNFTLNATLYHSIYLYPYCNKNNNSFIINDQCYEIIIESNFNHSVTKFLKTEEEKGKAFRQLKYFSKYSDIICLSLLITSLIYCFNESSQIKKYNYYTVITLFLLFLCALLFYFRYILFVNIKSFYNKEDKIKKSVDYDYDYDYYSPSDYKLSFRKAQVDDDDDYNDDYNNDDYNYDINKEYSNSTENYSPNNFFNFDSFHFPMCICMIFFILLYFVKPEKCNCCCKNEENINSQNIYPMLKLCPNLIDEEEKFAHISIYLTPLNFIFILVFIFDLINDRNIENYKEIDKNVIKNWEAHPIKSIELIESVENETNYFSWKGVNFKYEKMENYNYFNAYSDKDGQLCGKDSLNNDLYFPLDEECPINDIIISQIDKTIDGYKKIDLGNNDSFLYYTNKNIKGKIIIDFKTTNSEKEICYELSDYKCQMINHTKTIPFYENLDIWDNSFLYSVNYKGAIFKETTEREKINNYKNKIDDYLNLSKFKYVLFCFNLFFIVFFYFILLKGKINCLLYSGVAFIFIIFIYIIICGILVRINVKYIQNFINIIYYSDYEKDKGDDFWIIILLLLGIYYYIYYSLLLVNKYLTNDKKILQDNTNVIGFGNQNQERRNNPDEPRNEGDNRKCIICYEREPKIIFLPCAHRCCCEDCCNQFSNKFFTCPICRTKITGKIDRIYDA